MKNRCFYFAFPLLVFHNHFNCLFCKNMSLITLGCSCQLMLTCRSKPVGTLPYVGLGGSRPVGTLVVGWYVLYLYSMCPFFSLHCFLHVSKSIGGKKETWLADSAHLNCDAISQHTWCPIYGKLQKPKCF